MLEISQPTMNETSRSARRTTTDLAFIDQQNFEAAHCRVTRDTGAVDARTDDQQFDRIYRIHEIRRTISCHACTVSGITLRLDLLTNFSKLAPKKFELPQNDSLVRR